MKLFQESSEKVLIKAIYLKLSDNASVTEITDLKIKSLKIYDEIKKGSPFDMLAMNYKEIQGEFERGMMIPALDNRIFTLKEGEVSEPVWTREGAYILKAVKISKPSYKPIDAVREEIHEKIYEQKREEKFNEWMKWLWEKSSIHIRQ
jgi:peptidyl-prolyl cis-trans isomerase D